MLHSRHMLLAVVLGVFPWLTLEFTLLLVFRLGVSLVVPP